MKNIKKMTKPIIILYLILLFVSCKQQNNENFIHEFNLNEDVNSSIILSLITDIKAAESAGDIDLQIDKNIELSNVFIEIYEIDEALKYLNTAYALARNNSKQDRLNTIYYTIGSIYLMNKEYEDAKKYFLKSYQLSLLQHEGEQIIYTRI